MVLLRFQEWYSAHKRDVVVGVLIFLIGTLGFGLGYLYAKESNRAPIIIEQAARNGELSGAPPVFRSTSLVHYPTIVG